jgi:nitrogen regulatory protein P-II 1
MATLYDGEVKKVVAYIRPHSLEPVKTSLANLGGSGLSVGECRGHGRSPERQTIPNVIPLSLRSRVEIVLPDELVEPAIQAVISQARTGDSGDGMIFVYPIEDSLRIRTLEKGEEAL